MLTNTINEELISLLNRELLQKQQMVKDKNKLFTTKKWGIKANNHENMVNFTDN